jgi:integrase
LVENNVLAGYRGPPIVSRERVATQEELRLVWRALEAMSKHAPARSTSQALQVAILTLQRRSEVAGLCRGEIDFEARRWTIPASRTKNKAPQVVPLPPLAFQRICEGFEHTGTDYAFAGRKREIASTGHMLTRAFIRLRQEIGGDDLTVHDLRRTGATMLAEIGVSGDVISRMLNHTPPGPQVTKIYNRFDYEPQKRAALEHWQEQVLAIAGRDKP